MIAVHDPAIAERLRRLRQHAMDQSALARHCAREVVIEHYPERGWNARMTDLQAAVGLRQLEVLDTVLAERRRLAERYSERWRGCRGSAPRTSPTTPSAPGSPTRSGSSPGRRWRRRS